MVLAVARRRPVGLKVLLVVSVGLLSLTGSAGRAQESPELPRPTATEAAPLNPGEKLFYKGKGPGRGNSFVARYEEDYAYLRDPTPSSDWFDPFKFIPLSPDGFAYLTLNGEIRFRYDNTDHKNFAIATAATPSRVAGGAPTLTPATRVSSNQLYKQRYELGADLHVGDNFRVYSELYHGQQTGHDAGSPIPGNQRAELGLVNGFAEIYDVLDGAKTGLRVGRQEIFFGNNLQVRANVSTNLPSPVFDGFRLYRDWGDARLDAFAYNVVIFANGVLQERDNAHTNLWGLYGSYDLPKFVLAETEATGTIDLFYFGWRSSPFANGAGSAIYDDRAFLTGARIVAATGAGFISSQDHRNTLGLRYYGSIGDVDYDWQGAYQLGSYAGLRVDAFAFNTDTGLHLPRSAVEAAHRRPYRHGFRWRQHRVGHDAHLSADVCEHAVLCAEQRIRPDQFLRLRTAAPGVANRDGHRRVLLFLPVALFAGRRDLYRSALAGRQRPEQLRRDRADPGPLDRPSVRSARHLDDHAAPAGPGGVRHLLPRQRNPRRRRKNDDVPRRKSHLQILS